MKKNILTIVDDMALSRLQEDPRNWTMAPSYANWIRILRNYLRMTQAELAERANISQPHLAGIESGKTDPQISTLRRIYQALSCNLIIEPSPQKPLQEVLRGRARNVALKRLKQTMGTMALEDQAPNEVAFFHLLEKRTDEILNDRRERLWIKKDE